MKLKTFKNLIKKLNPIPAIGGLEIGDAVLRYALLNGEKIVLKESFVRLPAGVIVNGRVKDGTRLTAALARLRMQIGRRPPVDVIVSVSAANVYLQTFVLPAVAAGKLEEAARLNLRMISPVNIRAAYYDWEIIDSRQAGGGQPLDLLGGFVVREVIDELAVSLEAAGFNAAAVETAPMSLARMVSGQLEDAAKPHLVLNLSGDGLDFFILKNAKLHFSYFTSWNVLRKQGQAGVDLSEVKNMVNKELRRLISFYTSRWGELIEDAALVGMADNREIFEHVKNELNLKIHRIKTNAAAGAALRGLVPRGADHFISLASVDTEAKFAQNRVLGTVRFWRNAIAAVLTVILAAYGILDLAAVRSLAGVSRDLAAAPRIAVVGDVSIKQLEAEAVIFNALVEKAAAAERQSLAWSPLFRSLWALASQQVELRQVQLQRQNLFVSLNGRAGSERDILDFKNKLNNEPNFTEVSLPLTAIKMDVDGKANFTISFKLKKWEVGGGG